MLDPENDETNKLVYAERRQRDAIAYAQRERQQLADKVARHYARDATASTTTNTTSSAADFAAAATATDTTTSSSSSSSSATPPPSYTRSVDAFGDRSVTLRHSFSGSAEARVIHWWERLYWNYLRYVFTQELLIAKDRHGNKFTVTWQFVKNREEQRRMYRRDRDKRHLPYGGLATDDRVWVSWLRGQRGSPPSVAEEEHLRATKRQFLGPYVIDDEEVEDAIVRVLAHVRRSAALLKELDTDADYDDVDRTLVAQRHRDAHPASEMAARGGGGGAAAQSGATWTLAFVRGDLFYNEEETRVMRDELGHVFRNMEWQALEYKRHVRMNKPQHPRGLAYERKSTRTGSDSNNDDNINRVDGDDDDEVIATDANAGAGPPPRHYWERIDNDVPYHDAVPDLTTPMLERLRIEADQLEDERLALRRELGLTDLGDIREGRPPIVQDHAPFQPPPVSTRWRPRCWEETWGTGIGNVY